MAAQAHGRAIDAKSSEVKEFYIAIAVAWETIAAQVERAESAAVPDR